MADFLIRDLNPATKAALKTRAAANGRSASAEARTILDAEVGKPQQQIPADRLPGEGFGTYWARQFAEIGLTDEEHRLFEEGIADAKRSPQRPPIDFDR